MKYLLVILLFFFPNISLGNNDSIVNYLFSKYDPLIINGIKLSKSQIKSILNNVIRQNIDPHPFYMLDTNIRNNKIKLEDLKKSGCQFQKNNFMTCNLKGVFAEVFLNSKKIIKLVIKYNPEPFFKSALKNNNNSKIIQNFSRDLIVEFYNRRNFSNVKYYNMGKYVKVEMNYD